jgi:hypothetical protein
MDGKEATVRRLAPAGPDRSFECPPLSRDEKKAICFVVRQRKAAGVSLSGHPRRPFTRQRTLQTKCGYWPPLNGFRHAQDNMPVLPNCSWPLFNLVPQRLLSTLGSTGVSVIARQATSKNKKPRSIPSILSTMSACGKTSRKPSIEGNRPSLPLCDQQRQ